MDNLDDLKALWQSAKTDSLPNSKAMLQIIRKFRSQKIRNKWIVILSSALLACVIVAALFNSNFKLLTTYLGGSLMALACVWMAVNNFRSLKRFNQLDNCSNVDFLDFIEQTRQNQIYYYKRTMGILVLLWSVGCLMYMYEASYKHSLGLIIFYSAFLVYVAVLWFFVRPRSLKKNAEKLNAMKAHLESISKQLK
jgi:Flp pilus assembly protein TadB